ncbi:MAG TPA: TolC family protein, partial [Polyangiales bacterium]|nr:TolC family protein [Polyangiales bacterium]
VAPRLKHTRLVPGGGRFVRSGPGLVGMAACSSRARGYNCAVPVRIAALLCLWVSLAPPRSAAAEAESAPRELSLAEALRIASQRSPVLAQVRAELAVAEGRRIQSRAPLLPQVTASAAYARVHGAGTAQLSTAPGGSSADLSSGSGTYDRFAFGVAATQTIWDYEAIETLRAAGLTVDAARATERASQLQTALDVRTLFFQARAARALIGVQEAAFENQRQNLEEVRSFVQVGVRPEIDLLQAQTDLANARVSLLTARNTYGIAKASLRQAIGWTEASDFEVGNDTLPELSQEGRALPVLLSAALQRRPELLRLKRSRAAADATLSAARGSYWPTLAANAGASEIGRTPNDLNLNWNIGLSVNWQLFQGGLSAGQVDEARALLAVQESQYDTLVLQVQFEVEQARSTIENTSASLSAAEEALQLARSQLEQAQARYRQGISTIIELRDAQFGLTSASAQLVQAQLDLYRARAQLMAALGQDA